MFQGEEKRKTRRLILAVLIISALLLGACTTTPTPHGNYTATIVPDVYATANFSDDTVELYNPRDGKRIFEYEVLEGGTKIKLTNVETGETVTDNFKYIKKLVHEEEREVLIIGQLIYYPD